jgi:hypothetical protein
MKRENTGNKKWFAFDICSIFHFYFFSQTLIGKSKKDIKKVCPFSNIGNRIGKVGEKVLESIKV